MGYSKDMNYKELMESEYLTEGCEVLTHGKSIISPLFTSTYRNGELIENNSHTNLFDVYRVSKSNDNIVYVIMLDCEEDE